MRAGGGKQKGSQFERDIARRLSLWWSKGTDEKCLWRTHSSGGYGTVSNVKEQVGDVAGTNILGMKFTERYVVECKHYKEIDFTCSLGGKGKSIVIGWMDKLMSQLDGRRALLIMKANNKRTVLAFEGTRDKCYIRSIFIDGDAGPFLTLVDFEEWLEKNKPEN